MEVLLKLQVWAANAAGQLETTFTHPEDEGQAEPRNVSYSGIALPGLGPMEQFFTLFILSECLGEGRGQEQHLFLPWLLMKLMAQSFTITGCTKNVWMQ
jgi:hypothetical protein